MNLPLGYRYSALYAGIRKAAKPDLALIVSDTPASAAAVFTTNRVQAAPVKLSRENLAQSGGVARAVLVNAAMRTVPLAPERRLRSPRPGPQPRRWAAR